MNNILDAVKRSVRKNGVRLFMPGHKGRSRFMGGLFSKRQLQFDVTELDGTDNLHAPEGPILRAQEETAQAFGAEHTFFLVNGSTSGIYAMLGACCKAGDTVIVDRGCHHSVINAIVLFDLKPIYLYPEFNETFNIFSHIEPKKLASLLFEHPNAKAVLITSPTYYGRCSDLKQLVKITHAYHVPLLVDEAHGAHLCFSDELPMSAMQAGADCCVQSAHKTLPCVTQCAYLQLNSYYISSQAIAEKLDFFQTSSPSYLFMSALENAAIVMKNKGKKELDRIIVKCKYLCNRIERTGKIRCFQGDGQDATRLVFDLSPINVKACDFSLLLKKRGIYVEMAEGFHIVCIVSINNTNRDINRLERVILKLLKSFHVVQAEHKTIKMPEPLIKLQPQRAYHLPTKVVRADKAVGNVAARAVYCVPPGIPLVCPGEVIPPQILEYYQGKITIINENGE